MCVILPASVRKRTAVGQIGYDEWKVATMPSSFEYNHDGKDTAGSHGLGWVQNHNAGLRTQPDSSVVVFRHGIVPAVPKAAISHGTAATAPGGESAQACIMYSLRKTST